MGCEWIEEPDGKGGTIGYTACSWPNPNRTSVGEVQDRETEAPDDDGLEWGA
ncbi:hypothetical protein [Rhodococcus sp. A5(2022)]|uniref:hypothetical protein n=1 Tax=Rhodococcus sp. A5(2022) TaxID=3003588 RepID=UPI0022A8C64F|nr:hypothetical protein [Rhodococcus sp. A5(2022)]MCZ1075046.1 hypothetical protein [Rhodococcus sp. A5(2022)]